MILCSIFNLTKIISVCFELISSFLFPLGILVFISLNFLLGFILLVYLASILIGPGSNCIRLNVKCSFGSECVAGICTCPEDSKPFNGRCVSQKTGNF